MNAVVYVLLVLLWAVWYASRRTIDLRAIPVVGYSTPLLSMITSVQFVLNSQKVIDKGYRKFRGGLFRIRLLAHWIVVATDPQSVEDMRRAPPDVLSFNAASDVALQAIYLAGPQVVHDRSHVTWMKTELTRCNAERFEELREEMVVALNEQIPPNSEWKAYPVKEALIHVVFQMSNRLLVGEQLCRDRKYAELTISFASEFIKDVIVVKSCPEWLKPTAAFLMGNTRRCAKKATAYIQPLIERRDAAKAEKGTAYTPHDALQWFLDTTVGDNRLPKYVALRMLWINFAAIHSPTVTLVFALYHLASFPEYVQILREEVDGVLVHEGWSKAALRKMRKLDSFLKEVLRLNPPGIWSLQRLALQPFTFSNGQTVPAGTMIACPTLALHRDAEYYPDAREFKPWRHCETRADSKEGHKDLFVTTKADFITFGHGADACPGRFFAAVQMKALLAHIVHTYDVRFGEGQVMPERRFIAGVLLPGKADLEFRQRA